MGDGSCELGVDLVVVVQDLELSPRPLAQALDGAGAGPGPSSPGRRPDDGRVGRVQVERSFRRPALPLTAAPDGGRLRR